LVDTAKSIKELLSYSNREFISCAFLSLLGRKVDEQGEKYYMDRLLMGYSKMSVVKQLASSKEAKLFNPELNGLKRALFNERLLGLSPFKIWTRKNNQMAILAHLSQIENYLLATSHKVGLLESQMQVIYTNNQAPSLKNDSFRNLSKHAKEIYILLKEGSKD
jgi:hypothetical protein